MTIDNDTRNINSTDSWNFEISAFDDPIDYQFSIETLPIDSLTIDKKIVNSTECSNLQNSNLKCLKSNEFRLNLTKCANNMTLTFSYNINFNNEFKSQNIQIAPKNFTHLITFFCKFIP